MPFVDDIGGFLRWLKAYALGRGLLSTATLVATGISAALGFGIIIPAAVVAGGGAVLSIFSRMTRQSIYEDQMVELYRDDIALELGKAPADITRADLKEAAKSNEVLEQALERQKSKTRISIGTALLSAATTFGLVYFFGAAGGLHDMAVGALGKGFGFAANLVGIGTVSGLTNLVLHDGLQAAIGYKTGVSKAAAHDMILAITYNLQRGHGVSATQVYGVLVAGDPALRRRIAQQFGRDYASLPPSVQSKVLEKIGVDEVMQQLADDINHGASPGHLAYLIGETFHAARPVASNDEEPTRTSFVERLGLAPRHATTHAERTDAARSNAQTAAGIV
ncbi:MAG: hypothetical protein ACKVOE_00445 [Rickettsiales bacterium]